jgi:hypothetical protein
MEETSSLYSSLRKSCIAICDFNWMHKGIKFVTVSLYTLTFEVIFYFFSSCSHLQHRAFMNRFLSFQFLNLRQSVGASGCGISPSQGHYLTQTQNKHTQTPIPWVGFETTIPVFEWAKTVHVLQGNGPIRHIETCPDFFFTIRVHTTKSTVKIVAAKTHCKYFFFKLPKLLIFSVRGTACTRGLYNPS